MLSLRNGLNAFRRLIQEHPLESFFVLAYGLSWWPGILYMMGHSPVPIVGFGPFLAVVIVLACTGGKRAIGGLLRSMVRWRVEKRWYAVALLLPISIAALATGLNVLFGGYRPTVDQLSGFPAALAALPIFLLIPGLGGAWEEPGLRGFALPRFQQTRSPLVASLIMGVLHAAWHLPLFFTGEIKWPDIWLILAANMVLTWVFNGTRGNVFIIMLLHATNNAVSGNFFSALFSGHDAVRQSALLAALWTVAAIGVVAFNGKAFIKRPNVSISPDRATSLTLDPLSA